MAAAMRRKREMPCYEHTIIKAEAEEQLRECSSHEYMQRQRPPLSDKK
jgi:hypothetical protein